MLKHPLVLVLVILAVVAGAALRLDGMSRSLWIDEILSYQTANQPAAAVIGQSTYPVTYLLIHYMLKLGDTEALIRLPSYLAGLLAIWLIYHAARAASHSRQVGLISALFLCLSSIHIYYSQEARFYSFLPLAGILVLWTVLRALQRPGQWWWWLGFALSTALGVLTHPFFVPYAGSVAVGALVTTLATRGDARWRTVTKIAAWFALGLVPVVLLHWHVNRLQILGLVQSPDNPAAAGHFRLTLTDYQYYLRRLLHYQAPEHSLPAFLVFLVSAAWFAWRRPKAAWPVLLPFVLIPLPLLAVPVGHWYNEKYFIALLPPALIVIAFLLVTVTRAVVRRLGVRHPHAQPIVLGLVVVFLVSQYSGRNLYDWHWRPSWASLARDMSAHMTAADTVVHFGPVERSTEGYDPRPDSLRFYLRRMAVPGREDTYPTRHVVTDSPRRLESLLAENGAANTWVVHYHGSPGAPPIPAPLLRRLRPRVYHHGHLLYVQGRQTVNLVLGGACDAPPAGVATTGDVAVVRFEAPTRPGEWSARTSGTAVRLQASADGPHPAASFDTSAAALESTATYVLSYRLRFNDVPGNYRTTGSLQVRLTGTLPTSGETTSVLLRAHRGTTSGWRFFSHPVLPKLHPRAFALRDPRVEFRITGPRGAALIENVQLEQGVSPSPFRVAIR